MREYRQREIKWSVENINLLCVAITKYVGGGRCRVTWKEANLAHKYDGWWCQCLDEGLNTSHDTEIKKEDHGEMENKRLERTQAHSFVIICSLGN